MKTGTSQTLRIAKEAFLKRENKLGRRDLNLNYLKQIQKKRIRITRLLHSARRRATSRHWLKPTTMTLIDVVAEEEEEEEAIETLIEETEIGEAIGEIGETETTEETEEEGFLERKNLLTTRVGPNYHRGGYFIRGC